VHIWRTEDVEQRVLSNALVLWDRYAEANRRFSEERSEQLKSFANLSALITGFAIVAYLQVRACSDLLLALVLGYCEPQNLSGLAVAQPLWLHAVRL
jgi:hypothetical protein